MWRSCGLRHLEHSGSFAEGSEGIKPTESPCQLGSVHALPYFYESRPLVCHNMQVGSVCHVRRRVKLYISNSKVNSDVACPRFLAVSTDHNAGVQCASQRRAQSNVPFGLKKFVPTLSSRSSSISSFTSSRSFMTSRRSSATVAGSPFSTP